MLGTTGFLPRRVSRASYRPAEQGLQGRNARPVGGGGADAGQMQQSCEYALGLIRNEAQRLMGTPSAPSPGADGSLSRILDGCKAAWKRFEQLFKAAPEAPPKPAPTPKDEPKAKPKPAPKPPAPPKQPMATGTVRRGSHGSDVRLLQERLKAEGFDPGPVDGDFGPQTETAVKAFQRARHLEVDGIVGPQTWGALGVKLDLPPVPGDAGELAKLKPEQLAELGRTNKQAFFAALRPAAEAAEKAYGVPAAITLAQAAIESGWGAHAIGGYNIFGIKGTGPAGSVSVPTKEYVNGHYVSITAKFAKYHNFYEAVVEHGKLFHNGYYDKAVEAYKTNPSPELFAHNIQGIYATSPTYEQTLLSIMRQYHLS